MTEKPRLTDVRAAVQAVASSDRSSAVYRADGTVFVCTEWGSGIFSAAEWRRETGAAQRIAARAIGSVQPRQAFTVRRAPRDAWGGPR